MGAVGTLPRLTPQLGNPDRYHNPCDWYRHVQPGTVVPTARPSTPRQHRYRSHKTRRPASLRSTTLRPIPRVTRNRSFRDSSTTRRGTFGIDTGPVHIPPPLKPVSIPVPQTRQVRYGTDHEHQNRQQRNRSEPARVVETSSTGGIGHRRCHRLIRLPTRTSDPRRVASMDRPTTTPMPRHTRRGSTH